METIAICNQKGGTGKSTTAHAIGAGLSLRGYSVLYVDLDPQGNLSFILQADPKRKTIADLLQQSIEPEEGKPVNTADAIQHTSQGNVIASNLNLAGADTILSDVTGREYKLREILQPVKNSFDYCIIDTPPTLGTLTVNALTAAQRVIAPAQADILSLLAIGQLQSTIATVKRYCNPALTFSGIVLTRYNGRAILSREVAERIDQEAAKIGTTLYKTRIRECTALKEADVTQQSIYSYAPKSNAARDYTALIDEILEQESK